MLRHLLGVVLIVSSDLAHAANIEGDFDMRWRSDPANAHRMMELLSPVSFTDSGGKVWHVPAGALIDGASIPPALWSFAGSPFTGNYRRASVFHDYYCDIDTEKASLIHSMFREAMEFDGVPQSEALTKYAAVKLYSVFGGECGIEESIFDFFSANDQIDGFTVNDELMKEFESIAGASAPDSVEDRTKTVAAIAGVENPRTLEAMTSFRRIPSDENLTALDTAIRAEQPTDTELEALIEVAKATVPEGSITLPAN
jgi:hypothetical protein